MIRYINAKSVRPDCTRDSDFKVDTPRTCACCGVAYDKPPVESYYYPDADDENHKIISIYSCPSCENLFVVRYAFYSDGYARGINELGRYPFTAQNTTFDDVICKLSPDFVNIYHQAEQAEKHNLMKICGMGYRKALEFIVKDYAIHLRPKIKEDIEKQALGKCIESYIDNERIKKLAKASAWLGNDETHYIRKHDEYSVENLKAFIHALISFIASDLAVADAESLING